MSQPFSIPDLSRAVARFVSDNVPGRTPTDIRINFDCGKPLLVPISVIVSAVRAADEEPDDDVEDAPESIEDLSDMERDILLALADGPLKGAELARKAGYTEKGMGRNGVEPRGRLRQCGLIRNTQRGYELTEAGHDLLP